MIAEILAVLIPAIDSIAISVAEIKQLGLSAGSMAGACCDNDYIA